jgi:DUF4097 and DUF4098 domain-containing protein YvlB
VAGTCGWASEQAAAPAKDETPDRAVVPLSNPAKPARIEVQVMRGSITVRGYQGKEIIVEARTREKALTGGWGALSTGYAPYPVAVPGTPAPPAALAKPAPVPAPAAKSLRELEQAQKALARAQSNVDTEIAKQMEEQLAKQAELAKKLEGQYAKAGEFYGQFFEDDKKAREEKEKKIAGMKRLSGSSSGLEVEEADNVVTINTQSWKAATDLDIQVPVTSSLEIQSSMDGAVVVEGVSGEIDINNINGPVTLTNISGNTLVHTVNGDITAVITRLAADKPSSFSTMSGDLDVTLPRDIKASLKMKSDQGEIYSDFDINMTRQPAKSEPAEQTAQGRYRIAFDKSLFGTINGGGPEISFNTFRGDIYIRQKK